jgi:hypothetical protein
MPHTIPEITACCEVNTFDADVSPTVTVIDVAQLLRGAIGRSGHKHEYVAAQCGYKADYWSRALSSVSGEQRGFVLARLGLLPEDVQREFVMTWAAALGLRIERRGSTARSAAIRQMAQALMALIQAEA